MRCQNMVIMKTTGYQVHGWIYRGVSFVIKQRILYGCVNVNGCVKNYSRLLYSHHIENESMWWGSCSDLWVSFHNDGRHRKVPTREGSFNKREWDFYSKILTISEPNTLSVLLPSLMGHTITSSIELFQNNTLPYHWQVLVILTRSNQWMILPFYNGKI